METGEVKCFSSVRRKYKIIYFIGLLQITNFSVKCIHSSPLTNTHNLPELFTVQPAVEFYQEFQAFVL
jgi:hypothetical protein